MIKYIHQDNLPYLGDQLRSLFTYKLSKQRGDAIVAFAGKMDVKTSFMVDMEDQLEGDYIWSPLAINFIIEIFGISIEAAVLYQRTFMRIITDELIYLKTQCSNTVKKIELKGDDIYLYTDGRSDKYKMSVSIATVSPLSGLIHTGLNVLTDKNIPVPALGLKEAFQIDDKGVENFIGFVMDKFCEYVHSVKQATIKVRSVQ